MTKEELIEKLRECQEISNHDQEEAHIRADDLLLEYIGEKDVTFAFIDINKWYA